MNIIIKDLEYDNKVINIEKIYDAFIKRHTYKIIIINKDKKIILKKEIISYLKNLLNINNSIIEIKYMLYRQKKYINNEIVIYIEEYLNKEDYALLKLKNYKSEE